MPVNTSPIYKDEKPGVVILWRYLNNDPRYLIQFTKLRWSVSEAPEVSCIYRFEQRTYKKLCQFQTQFHTDRALYILKHLQNSSPSILSKLDDFFFTVLSDTVHFTPFNFTSLNLAIQRCLCLA